MATSFEIVISAHDADYSTPAKLPMRSSERLTSKTNSAASALGAIFFTCPS